MPVVEADTRANLLTLREDVDLGQRFTVNGRFAVLTTAVLQLDDQVMADRDRIDQRLGRIELDLGEVKTDVAGLKTDMTEVKTRLDTVETHLDQVRVLAERLPKIDAHVERLVGLIEREERGGKQPPAAN